MGNFNPDVEAPGFEMPSWAGPSSKLVNWAIPQQPLPKRTASACGRRERRVFRHQPRKKHTHKIKDPSSGWSWKKYSNMFSSNLYYQWPWKVMHLVYVAMITMKKNWQTAIWPLCVGPRGAIQQQGSSLWAPFNDLAIWPMSLQWLVLFSNDLVMIYICMYVCMHACMHVCMYACMYACTDVCMYECMHAWNYALHYVRKCRKKWKVAEIENLPKLKGGGVGTEIISRNVWGYPP